MGIVNSKLLNFGTLSALLWTTCAGAAGLGEIALQSRVGEPLRAEVPVWATNDEPIGNHCFTLNAVAGADLPVITAANTRLVRNGADWRLVISSKHPIHEPIFMISVRTSCGQTLQRDYVLMPEAPLPLSEATRQIVMPQEEPVSRKQAVSRERQTPASVSAPRPQREKPPARDLLAKLAATGGDRVLLGAEPVEARQDERLITGLVDPNTVEGRMLKMETSLHSLDQQMANLSAALAVTAETVALRQKLMAAQARPSPAEAVSTMSPQAPATTNHANSSNWLELLLSALAGGLISGGVAHYLSRRLPAPAEQRRRTEAQA